MTLVKKQTNTLSLLQEMCLFQMSNFKPIKTKAKNGILRKKLAFEDYFSLGLV